MLHHIKHNHTQARIRRHTNTRARKRNTAGLLHSRLLHIHSAFGAFIRRDSWSAHVNVGCNRQNTSSDLQKAHRQQARHGTARRRTTRQLASSRAVEAEPKEIGGRPRSREKACMTQAGRNTQFKSRIMSAVHPQSNTVQGPQHISGQEIDGHLTGGRIGHRVAEHQLFIEE